MTIRIYRSTDIGAPVLNAAAAGSLIGVLDACLVNGYGSMPAMGYTKAFSGTNEAAYLRPSPESPFYLYINDLNSESFVKGYENMTSISNGTGVMPPAHFTTTGLYWRKGLVTNMVWEIIADERGFYLYLGQSVSNTYSITGSSADLYYWGEFNSEIPNDEYNILLSGKSNTGIGNPGMILNATRCVQTSSPTLLTDRYVHRNSLQQGIAKGVTFINPMNTLVNPLYETSTSPSGSGNLSYPNIISNKLWYGRYYITDLDLGIPRGTLRGLKAPLGRTVDYQNNYTNRDEILIDGERHIMYCMNSISVLATAFIKIDGTYLD